MRTGRGRGEHLHEVGGGARRGEREAPPRQARLRAADRRRNRQRRSALAGGLAAACEPLDLKWRVFSATDRLATTARGAIGSQVRTFGSLGNMALRQLAVS